jgi:hypothetical protein
MQLERSVYLVIALFQKCIIVLSYLAIPVVVWSKAWVLGRSLAGIAGSNPVERIVVCSDCCVLSGRGLCDGLITRPEESYRLWCVVVCDLETSSMGRPWPAWERSAKRGVGGWGRDSKIKIIIKAELNTRFYVSVTIYSPM